MKDFLKRYWKWLIILLVVPLSISYLVFAFNGFVPAGSVGKEIWLSFWGGFLAFYGTMFLGFVALWQNEKANEYADKSNKSAEKANAINQKLIELTEKANEISSQVFKYEIERQKPLLSMRLDNYGHYLFLFIQNTGGTVAEEIKITIKAIENNNSVQLDLDGLF